MIASWLKKAKKIVIKIGTNTLSTPDGLLDKTFFSGLAAQIAFFHGLGKEIVLVSSGARITGASSIQKWHRKEDIHYKQALCAIGQVMLMESYRKSLGEHGILIGQILLTREDFADPIRTLHIRNTLFTLVDEGVIPIINENDSVSVEEIKIGDNDTLAAQTAKLWNADLLIILSDIDGVYNKNPKEHSDAQFLEYIHDLVSMRNSVEIGNAGSFGTGGIRTKIEAAEAVNQYGIPMILTNGKREDILIRLTEGKSTASLFLPQEEELKTVTQSRDQAMKAGGKQ